MTVLIPKFLSANRRSGQQYEKIIIALRNATKEINNVKASLDDLLVRLLPHVVAALEAESGYIYHRKTSDPSGQFYLLGATAADALESVASAALQELAIAEAEILDDSEIDRLPPFVPRPLINAIVAPLRMLERQYLVVVCNKQTDAYPFLAGDRVILEFLLTVMSAELRAEERLLREHEAVQRISELVAAGKTDDLWLVIAQSAAQLSNAKYAQIYSFEEDRNWLAQRCSWNAETKTTADRNFVLPLHMDSLNGHVASTRAATHVADLNNSKIPYHREKFEEDAKTAYAIPLISQNTLVGTLYIAKTEPGTISQEDCNAVDRLAPHAAVALNTARLLEEKQRNLDLDELIIDLQQELADVLREEGQIQQIEKVLKPHFTPAFNPFLALWDEAAQRIELHIVHEGGQRHEPSGHELYDVRRRGERRGLIDYMLGCDRDVLDIPNFQEWPHVEEIEPDFRKELHCCLVIALKHRGQLVGWLGFRGYENAYMFDERQRELLQRLAPHIATVLFNSRQYEQKIKEREVVSKFQTQISELTETEAAEIAQISQAVKVALEKLAITTTDMYIALVDQEKEILHIPLVYVKEHELTEAEKEADPLYRTRHPNERKGFTEHILATNESVLVKTRQELEAWKEKGLDVLPSHFCCWVGVPMRVLGRTIGVMALRSTTTEYLFDQNHVELLQTVANQAAITLENARQYERVQQTSRYNAALNKASREISRAQLTENAILQEIVKQAVESTGSHLGVIYRSDPAGLKLSIKYPPDTFHVHELITPEMPTIINKAFRLNKAQLAPDVTKFPDDFWDTSGGATKGQLSVVLRAGGEEKGEKLGVISIEHPKVNRLSNQERDFVIGLADLAAVAIQNAERVRTLQRNTTVAIMGAWGAEIMHTINRRVGEIRTTVFSMLLEDQFSDETRQALRNIDFMAGSMLLGEFHRGKSSGVALDNNQEGAILDEVLQSEINHYRVADKAEIRPVQVRFRPGCANLKVKVHERWLRILINHYLSNATRHLLPTAQEIMVWTERQDNQAVVYVENTGQGIAEQIRPLLFEEPVEPTEHTSGRGLLLVRFICEHHQGRAWLVSSAADEQTCFAFSIPVINE
jgi:GAF domain-containing protein